MNPFSSRPLHVFVLLCLIFVVGAYSTVIYSRSRASVKASSFIVTQKLPSDGFAANDTKGLVPGNPENGRKQLTRLFALYQKYKTLHGTMPPEVVVLTMDILKQPKQYGFTNHNGLAEYLANPDHKYSDDAGQRGNAHYLNFGSSPTRPDKTPVFGPKPAGQRDVLAYTTFYIHNNQRDFPGRRTTLNPVGFYQVLWDDGQVEDVPYDKLRYWIVEQRGSNSKCAQGFAGQAGIPTHTMSYDDYWTKIARWDTAPRGSAGGKGMAFNGQSYR